MKRRDDGNFFAAYKARGPLVCFLLVLGSTRPVLSVRAQFPDVDHYYFEGRNLNAMLTTGWNKLPPLPRGAGGKRGR